jgi:hypothetical protein
MDNENMFFENQQKALENIRKYILNTPREEIQKKIDGFTNENSEGVTIYEYFSNLSPSNQGNKVEKSLTKLLKGEKRKNVKKSQKASKKTLKTA